MKTNSILIPIRKLSDRKERLFTLFLFAIYFFLAFALYVKYFSRDLLVISGDGIAYSSFMIYMKRALSDGSFPLWNKYLAGGMPNIGHPDSRVLYLPTILLSWLPMKEFIYVFYALHLSVGAVFTYKYLREIKCDRPASVCISLLYMLSIHLGGYRKGHITIISCIVYLPIVLFYIERYFRTKNLKFLVLSSAVMALQFYNAFLQDVVYMDLFLAVYLIAYGIAHRIKLKTMLKHGAIWILSYAGLIMAQAIPMAQMLIEYGKHGVSGMDYGTFLSYSIHPIKLLQVIYPEIFGDPYQAFGIMYSSEMDIEIFLGFMVALMVLFAVIRIRNIRIYISFAFMVVTLCYAMMAHIPWLANIIYRIPLINNFRVPSRILFISIFLAYTIAAVALCELKHPDNSRQFSKLSIKVIIADIFIIVSAGIAAIMINTQNGFDKAQISSLYDNFKNAYLKQTFIMICGTVLIYIIHRYTQKNGKKAYILMCMLVAATTLIQTLPYTLVSAPASLSLLSNDDPVSKILLDDLEEYKVWDAFQSINGAHMSPIALDLGMVKEIPSINAYVSLNNPLLYRMLSQEAKTPLNFSGLLTGSLSADKNLKLQNDLLSMLGIKYIIDSSDLVGDGNTISAGQDIQIIYESDEFIIQNMGGDLFLYYEVFDLKPDMLYRIDISVQSNTQQYFYFDIYGGELYDSQAQQVDFISGPEKKHYTKYIYSGDISAYDIFYWRLVAQPTDDIIIKDFRFTEVESMINKSTYIPFYEDEQIKIFENTNVRDVLYIPGAVEGIDSDEDIYINQYAYDLDDISYIKGAMNKRLNPDKVKIQNIDFRYNNIKANVITQDDTFLNFSQCYYPGWRAYIDGNRTELYLVNGLIMGMNIPAGGHEIEFRYVPVGFYIGLCFTVATCAAIIIWFVFYKRKKERNIVDEDSSQSS